MFLIIWFNKMIQTFYFQLQLINYSDDLYRPVKNVSFSSRINFYNIMLKVCLAPGCHGHKFKKAHSTIRVYPVPVLSKWGLEHLRALLEAGGCLFRTRPGN
jgi:hypothetical protein